MFHQENPFLKSSLDSSREKDPTPRVARFREDISYSLKKGTPLILNNPPPNGDRMIRHWSASSLLEKFARKHGIDKPKIKLAYEGDGLFFDKNIDSISHQLLGSYPPVETNEYWACLVKGGASLGLNVDYQDLIKVPQPQKSEKPPFTNIDRELIIGKGRQFRHQKPETATSITVVAQSGSNPTKRFSDKQVVEIAEAVKREDPATHLVIVSDKKLLGQILGPKIEMANAVESGGAKGGYVVDSRGFPITDPEFRQSLAVNPYQDIAQAVVIDDDINTICSVFYSADRIITSDGFWAWLGAGSMAMRNPNGVLNSDSLFVLYTVASSRRWGIPGAVSVESEAIGLERMRGRLSFSGIIDPLSYVDNTTKDYENRPIADKDINMLITEYRQRI